MRRGQEEPNYNAYFDAARGCPAAGVAVHLTRKQPMEVGREGEGHTDDDGRFKGLMAPGTLTEGVYRISFDTAGYYRAINGTSFFLRYRSLLKCARR